MRSAIESEAKRIGVALVSSHPSDELALQFSTSFGTDTHQGRLWTNAADGTRYELLCRAVKKGSFYDRESGLWVKRTARTMFDIYKVEQQRALSKLVARNRKYAAEVLGADVAKGGRGSRSDGNSKR